MSQNHDRELLWNMKRKSMQWQDETQTRIFFEPNDSLVFPMELGMQFSGEGVCWLLMLFSIRRIWWMCSWCVMCSGQSCVVCSSGPSKIGRDDPPSSAGKTCLEGHGRRSFTVIGLQLMKPHLSSECCNAHLIASLQARLRVPWKPEDFACVVLGTCWSMYLIYLVFKLYVDVVPVRFTHNKDNCRVGRLTGFFFACCSSPTDCAVLNW